VVLEKSKVAKEGKRAEGMHRMAAEKYFSSAVLTGWLIIAHTKG